MTLRPLLLSLPLLACTNTVAGPPDTFGTSTTSGSAQTSSDSTTTGSSTTAGSGSSSSTGEPTPLCDAIEVALVLDPDAPAWGIAARQAYRTFLDRLVEDTGAEVRLLVNLGIDGTDDIPPEACTAVAGATTDGKVIVWGQDFETDPLAPAVLTCVLDEFQNALPPSVLGDDMFSGLMFPILDSDGPWQNWPGENVVGVPIVLAETDDEQNGMYPRPGMTTEAYLRLVTAGERKRVAVLTGGQDADELELFALSFDRSLYADWSETDLPTALEAFTPNVIETCKTAFTPPPPVMNEGCKHVDVLFVIDGSFSMFEVQEALRGVNGPPVFKDFTDALLDKLPDVDGFRVGVVSAQPGDLSLHTHMDQPEIAASPETDCAMDPNAPWLDGPSPTFESQFACVAATRANTEEYVTYNAAHALLQPQNAGFLHDDGILVVVMLTDEETQEWFEGHTRVGVREALMSVVSGDLSRLFVVGIAGGQGTFEAPHTVCGGPYGTAVPGRRISSIVYSFRDQGVMQDICEGDLASTFSEILGDVAATCEAFVPPG